MTYTAGLVSYGTVVVRSVEHHTCTYMCIALCVVFAYTTVYTLVAGSVGLSPFMQASRHLADLAICVSCSLNSLSQLLREFAKA